MDPTVFGRIHVMGGYVPLLLDMLNRYADHLDLEIPRATGWEVPEWTKERYGSVLDVIRPHSTYIEDPKLLQIVEQVLREAKLQKWCWRCIHRAQLHGEEAPINIAISNRHMPCYMEEYQAWLVTMNIAHDRDVEVWRPLSAPPSPIA